MEWINENSGLLVLIAGGVILALVIVALIQNCRLQQKIVSQRLNFLGLYSEKAESHEKYVKLVVGNKSLVDFGFSELGIRHGKVTVDLTAAYREKKKLPEKTRLSIEQKNTVELCLSAEELKKYLVGSKTKFKLGTLSLYLIDLSGRMYTARIPQVRKLLKETLREKSAA